MDLKRAARFYALLGHPAVTVLQYLVGYLALRTIAIEHPAGLGMVAPWNGAPALSVALVYWRGSLFVPLVFLAPWAAWFLGAPSPAGVGPLAGIAIEGGVMAAMGIVLRRWNDFQPELTRLRDTLAVVGLSLGAAMLMAVATAAVLGQVPGTDWQIVRSGAGLVFLVNAVALTSLLPLLLIHGKPRRWTVWHLGVTAEGGLQVIALAVIAWEVFGRFVNADLHFFYLLFLPFAWIASRHGQATVAVALASAYLALIGSDWLFSHREVAILDLEIRYLALVGTSLVLGAATSERRAAEARMLARQAELAHVLRLNVGWEMASALAHELNQPLSAAMNYIQGAARLLKNDPPNFDRAQWAMDQSLDRIEHMGSVIRGLRDFMKKSEIDLLSTDIAGVIDEALKLLEAEASTSGVRLRAEGFAGLPPVLADKAQITQVIVNLVRNAIQAIVAAETADGWITVTARRDEDDIEVMVRDNGPGLAPEVAAKLFEPFVTTKHSGMGLGLSIVKSIIEAHGGRVRQEDAGEGTAFGFTLPLAPQGDIDD